MSTIDVVLFTVSACATLGALVVFYAFGLMFYRPGAAFCSVVFGVSAAFTYTVTDSFPVFGWIVGVLQVILFLITALVAYAAGSSTD